MIITNCDSTREPTTNSTHICCRRWDLNPGHSWEACTFITARHPCSHISHKNSFHPKSLCRELIFVCSSVFSCFVYLEIGSLTSCVRFGEARKVRLSVTFGISWIKQLKRRGVHEIFVLSEIGLIYSRAALKRSEPYVIFHCLSSFCSSTIRKWHKLDLGPVYMEVGYPR